MIFEVDSTILEAEQQHLLLLEVTSSVWGSEMGRHQWYILDPETFKSSSWFAKYLSEPQKRDFEKFVTRSALENPKRKRNFFKVSTVSDGANAVFSLPDARKLLSSPLIVVVEGAGSDGTFVKALIRCFPNKSIKAAVEHDWITFENAGGSGGLKASVGRIEARLGKEVAKRRTYGLFDSDHEHSQDNWRTKDEAKARLELEQDGYTIHCLYKRMIENYLPDEALKEIVNKHGDDAAKARLKVVLTFSNEQRDFYHLKSGFNDKGKVPENQSNLFSGALANSSSQEFAAIRKGFGKQFPLAQGFDSINHVTAAVLRARCTHHPNEQKDELEIIVKTLTEML